MPNSVSIITPALEVLGKSINVLPATERAVEDLQHPGQDEVAAEMWGLTQAELKEIQDSLEELR